MSININELSGILKDGAKGALTEAAKQEVVTWVADKGVPAARDVVEEYSAQLKAQAENEKGWCKFRDSIFLPAIFNIALWAAGTLAAKIITNATVER